MSHVRKGCAHLSYSQVDRDRLISPSAKQRHFSLQSSTWAGSSSSVQVLSCVRLFATPWTTACQASLSITNSWSLLKLMSFESVMPSNHLILCRPRHTRGTNSLLRIKWQLKYKLYIHTFVYPCNSFLRFKTLALQLFGTWEVFNF